MIQHKKNVPVSGMIVLLLVFLNAVIAKIAFIRNENWYWALVVTAPLLLIAIWDIRQKKHAVLRNYPVLGHLRYFSDKKVKVANFNANTLIATKEMIKACGLKSVKDVLPPHPADR